MMADAVPTLDDRAKSRALLLVFVIVFIDLLGFGIVMPIIPRQVKPYCVALGWEKDEGLVIAAIFSSFSLMQFLFSPVLGRMSDRLGRRPILLLSLGGSVLSYALYAFASSLAAESAQLALALMLISRIGAGIAGASVGTAAAVIADSTTRERRGKGMALIGAAFGIGFTFGPLIAYLGLTFFGHHLWGVGALASILSLVAFLLAWTKLPETRFPGGHQAGRDFSLSRTLETLRSPSVGPLIFSYFLAITAFANFEATLAKFTEEIFRMTEQEMYGVFIGVGLVLSITGGIYRPLVGIRSEFQLMILGIGMMIMGFAGIAIVAYAGLKLQSSPSVAAGLRTYFYIAGTLAVVGFAFVNPSVSALISKRADPERQGEIIGVNQSAASMARILGPAAGAILFGYDPSHMAPYILAVVLLFGVIGLTPLLKRSGETR